jgi:uncharacterized Zn finger protein (UPF0148 family)
MIAFLLYFSFSMILCIIASLPVFVTLMAFLYLCPGVHAAGVESAFPNISFEIFSTFIQSTFSPKISLSTVLMLLFTLNQNTDLLNLHAHNQNPHFKYEQKCSSSTWMNALSQAIQQKTNQKKMKSLFTKDERPSDLTGSEARELLSIKLDSFANLLGLNPFGEDGKLIQKIYPISNDEIQPILVLCPTSYVCMDGECEAHSLLMLTCLNQVPEVTLVKGTKIFKKVSVLSAHCPKCKTAYFVDHETYGPLNRRKRNYLNDAYYFKVGQNTYVDRVFSKAVLNGIYSFHASTAAYSEFWTNSFGKNYSIKIPRRQIWQTFIQESIRSIASAADIIFEANINLPIADLTNQAYCLLGENGGIRLSNGHTCSECTQDYKATADYAPQHNDPAALLGLDDDRPVPALVGADANANPTNIPNQPATAPPPATNSPVKMIVIDGIVMGPAHCAADNCTAELLTACGELFCPTHVTQFGNQCRVVGCRNIKVQYTQACTQHQPEWLQHRQSRTKSTLAGVHRMLSRQHENLAWNQPVE